MSEPKKHHRVPKSYLASFCNGDGRLWVYDPRAASPRSSLPVNEAVETDLYSVIRNDGTRDTRMEELLAQIEDGGMPLLKALAAGSEPRGEDRELLCLLIASIYLRSDSMRQRYADFHARSLSVAAKMMLGHDGAWATHVRRIAEEEGKVLTDVDRAKAIAFIGDPSRYELHVRKDSTLAPRRPQAAVLSADGVESRAAWTVLLDHPGEGLDDLRSLGRRQTRSPLMAAKRYELSN